MSSEAPARPPVPPDTTAWRLLSSAPLVLDRPDEAWYLTEGEVDVFVVPIDDRGVPGRRSHVASVGPGALLVGAPAVAVDGQTWRLVAVGVDASAVPLDPGWLASLATQAPLAHGLHAWLSATGTACDSPGPRRALSVAQSGQTLSLTAGDVVNAPADLVWLAPDAAVLCLGDERQPVPLLTPVGAAFSTTVAGAATAVVRRTDEVAVPDLGAGLAWVQRATVCTCAALAAGRSRDEAVRRAGMLDADGRTRARAHESLQRIERPDAGVASPTDDPVLAACRLLGRLTDIAIQSPPAWSRALSPEPIRAIARASRARVRAVTLDDGWWQQSADPMIAFREPDGAPVVLMPRPSGGVTMVDPVTNVATRITAQTASGLRPTGYVVYRPLPPGPVTIGGLLRFGFTGSGRDGVKVLAYSLVVGLLSLAIPVGAGTILGQLVPVGETGPVAAVAVLLVIVVLASSGFMLSRSAALLRVQGRMLGRMQAGLWDRLLSLPAAFYSRYPVAELSQRFNGVETIQDTVSSVASRTLLAVVSLVFSLGLLFSYDVGLAFAVLLMTVAVLGVGAAITVAQVRILRAMYVAKAEASSILLQIVKGIEKIHAAAAEDRALGVWASHFAEQSRLLLVSSQWWAARTALYAMLPSALTLVVFSVILEEPGKLGPAAFLSFIAALAQIAVATTQIDLSLGTALTVIPMFKALEPILAEAPEVGPDAADPGVLNGRIALSAVDFRYPGTDRPTLRDVTLTVEPGEFVAFVGTSGSGKSTVVRLLLGFEQPTSGSVTYDGKDLSTLNARAVREQIGVAMQNAGLSGSDIFSVIAGDRPLTEDEAMAAAEKVGLADDIRALPLGLRTSLGEGGATFSGGQRQRMVLAAAIARDPRVVILDEATSALDSIAQAVVAASFGGLQVTRIVVAHRLSAIRHADRIVVMDAGRIVQEGTFDVLAEQPGIFREMVRRQTI